MPLPKLSTPIFDIKVPSKKTTMKFRPFLVKEEKLLLIGQQSDSAGDMILAIKQVINNCCLDELDIDSLASFDLEYIFIKLRARSVENVVTLQYRDNEDQKIYDFEVNLDEIEVNMTETVDNNIQLTDGIGITLHYPNVSAAERLANIKDEQDILNRLMLECIDTIYDSETVYPVNEYTEQEIMDFIDNIDAKSFRKVEKFFESMPKLSHTLKYTNSLGNERSIELNSVQDFLA